MSDSFIPRSDADALVWFLTFSSGISSSPNTYQLSASDATTIAAAVSAFQVALLLAEAPLTRTPGNINDKDIKRNACESLCRQYALQIEYSNAITDGPKIAIPMRPESPIRELIFAR